MARISLILLLTFIMTPHTTLGMQETILVGTSTCMCTGCLIATVACCMKYRECQQSRVTTANTSQDTADRVRYPVSQRRSSHDIPSYVINQPDTPEPSRNSQFTLEEKKSDTKTSPTVRQ